MSRTYVALGKYGDVMSVLPILYSDASRGQRATLMIHKQFADLLDGVKYCDGLIWEGNPNDINGAIAEALKTSPDVRCCQVVGDPEAVRQLYQRTGSPHATTDSFQKESWRVAGRMDLWKEQPPLVFDNRDKEREQALVGRLGTSRNKKYLLLAMESKSSPFPYAMLLRELVRLKFKTGYIIVDLADYKAERIYDLLAIYEKAWALIAVDSAPLHLARAVPTLPVVALTQDKPSLWHGSTWMPQHVCYIRYSDFPTQATEMLRVLENLHCAGSYFGQRNGRALIHAYHEYYQDPDWRAMETWETEYPRASWIHTPAQYGVFGRDSKRSLKDDKRLPFVKDVVRMATMRARDNDVICLTRHDTCFEKDLGAVLKKENPCFIRREVRSEEGETYHPMPDLFAFTKEWWRQHQGEFPDFVMGNDQYWPRVLSELIKKHGGKEVKGGIWKEE